MQAQPEMNKIYKCKKCKKKTKAPVTIILANCPVCGHVAFQNFDEYPYYDSDRSTTIMEEWAEISWEL